MRVDGSRLEAVRRLRPLVHCISNIVSANDCANLALAVGASPMMAQASQEMENIAAASAAEVLNTGTPEEEKFRACLLCGQTARRLGRPVILDPVGVGASPWRLRWVETLLENFTPVILRVNLGEAQALLGMTSQERGVDSLSAAGREQQTEAARRLSRERGCAVLLSGKSDIIAAGETVWQVSGGSEGMTRITGTGCMLSVLCGVFAAVEPDGAKAALLASVFWKICARRAERQSQGPGSFRAALLDAAGTLTAADVSAAEGLEILFAPEETR